MNISDIKTLAHTLKQLKDDNLIDGTFELCAAIVENFNLTPYEEKQFSQIMGIETIYLTQTNFNKDFNHV
jgi:hypothetical protein